MAAPQNVSLPAFFNVSDGMQVRLTALDPLTGAEVTTVTISEVSIDVDQGGEVAPAPPLDPLVGAYMQGDNL